MDEQRLKKTALHTEHLAEGAKMVPFAGYDMPVQYEGLKAEHFAVREKAGIFDVSHMGEFIVKGSGARAFLQWVTSNDVDRLVPGKVQYSCLPNETGGIVDDLLVYCLNDQEFLLVVNASNIQKDWDWLHRWTAPYDVELEDQSHEWSLLAVQGPKVAEMLQPLTEIPLAEMPYYSFSKGNMAGVSDILISATGYTGAGGFELYVKNQQAVGLWKKIRALGAAPAGLGARDTLRLEKAFCLYGNDLSDTTSPLEAGLGWITKFKKDFIQKEHLLEQKSVGLKKKLIGFEMVERGIPRKGYAVFSAQGEEIGEVSSGTHSPSLGHAIGLAYIDTPHRSEGTELQVQIRNKKVKAKVVTTPFL
jgi:aminomethyltransferase